MIPYSKIARMIRTVDPQQGFALREWHVISYFFFKMKGFFGILIESDRVCEAKRSKLVENYTLTAPLLRKYGTIFIRAEIWGKIKINA